MVQLLDVRNLPDMLGCFSLYHYSLLGGHRGDRGAHTPQVGSFLIEHAHWRSLWEHRFLDVVYPLKAMSLAHFSKSN